MKRHIDKPYKINLKTYISIGLISVVALFTSVFYNDFMGSKISDVVKNMSIGCLASVIVALIIEIGSNKERNMNANTVYDLVYGELEAQILFYVSTWAYLCSIAFPKLECSQERHTWSEWYELTKINFLESDDSTQEELMCLFKSELLLDIDGIEKAILKIEDQQYILEIDRLLNNELKVIIRNLKTDFNAIKIMLTTQKDKEAFWSLFDNINHGLETDIEHWEDIRFYNCYMIKPFDFCNIDEMTKAIYKSNQVNR